MSTQHRDRTGPRQALRERLALAKLTDRQKQCLALYFYDGLTQERVGCSLGIRQRAVSYHLQAGLRKLTAVSLRPRPVAMEAPSMTWMDTETLDKIPDGAVVALW